MTTASQTPFSPPSVEQEDGLPRLWSCDEFHRGHDLGLFRPEERLELVRGQIYYRDQPGRPRRWTREEYYRAADLGLFDAGERLELIEGEIIRKVTVQKRPHALAISIGARVLQEAFGPTAYVSHQSPIHVSDQSEPEPDLAVIAGTPEDYLDHPTPADVLLVVEVSDTTLRLDRGRKAALYAGAGVRDYWVENLPHRILEVYRDPAPRSDQDGFEYRSITTYTVQESVAPLAAPQALVRVADLLPPPRPMGKPRKEKSVGEE